MGWSQIYIADPKREFSALLTSTQLDRLAVEADEVIAMLNRVCDIVRDRQIVVSDGVKKRQKMGPKSLWSGLTSRDRDDRWGERADGIDGQQAKERISDCWHRSSWKVDLLVAFWFWVTRAHLLKKGITTDIERADSDQKSCLVRSEEAGKSTEWHLAR